MIRAFITLFTLAGAVQTRNEHVTLLSSAPRSFVSSQALYQRFDKMFGPSLQRAFASPLTLQHAIDSSQTVESSYSRKTACASYATGSALSTKVRLDKALAARSGLFVFYQSRKEDLVCFYHKYLPPDLLASVKYSYPIPSGLKIHSMLYKTIDRMAHQSTFAHAQSSGPVPHLGSDFHLTVTTHFGDTAGARDVLALAGSLVRYDMTVYKAFFWTAAQQTFFKPLQAQALAVPSHYVDLLSLEMDRQRSKTWSSLSSVLKQFNIKGNSTQSLSLADPCQFASVRRKQYTGKLTLSVTHLLNHPSAQMGAACLSFMVAHFLGSPESSVFHLSLTSDVVLLNNHARSIIEGASPGDGQNLDFQVYTAQALTGDGQVIGMADTGVDVNSCFFYDDSGSVPPADISSPITDFSRRKIIQYTINSGADDTDSAGGHGTHVAGSLVGYLDSADIGSDSLGMYDGVASGAKLAVMDLAAGSSEGLAIPGSADALYNPGYSAGARVYSNSWGSFLQSGDQGHYASSDLDSYLQSHPDMTIFFAAGNQGDVAYSVSMEAQAKNVIAVASSETTLNSESIDNVAWYSSFGPAYDGRIKPDITSPGDSLMSASAAGDGSQTCDTITKTGTSQATPTAAGSAALMRQYFADGNFFSAVCDQGSAGSSGGCGAFTSSGVLIKALVLHSGMQMAQYHNDGSDQQLSSPPDSIQGHGRVTLKNILPLPQAGYTFFLYVDDQATLGADEEKTYTLHVTDSSYPLKATVSWYDVPNQDGISTQALLNDLDMLLVSPSGTQWYGNGANTGNAGFDSVNNNEQVFVATPDTGDWTLTISSHALFSADAQPFSLVATMQGSVDNTGGDSAQSSGDEGGDNDTPQPTDQPTDQPQDEPSSGENSPDTTCSCPQGQSQGQSKGQSKSKSPSQGKSTGKAGKSSKSPVLLIGPPTPFPSRAQTQRGQVELREQALAGQKTSPLAAVFSLPSPSGQPSDKKAAKMAAKHEAKIEAKRKRLEAKIAQAAAAADAASTTATAAARRRRLTDVGVQPSPRRSLTPHPTATARARKNLRG